MKKLFTYLIVNVGKIQYCSKYLIFSTFVFNFKICTEKLDERILVMQYEYEIGVIVPGLHMIIDSTM